MRRLLALAAAVVLVGAIAAPTASAFQEGVPHGANVLNRGIDLVGETFVVTGRVSNPNAFFCGIRYEGRQVASPGIGLDEIYGTGLVEINFNIPVQPGDRFVVVSQGECSSDSSRSWLVLEPVG